MRIVIFIYGMVSYALGTASLLYLIGFLGNIVMGLVFGRFWQRTNRLWPLLIAHATIDVVAYIGYTLLHGHLAWLP